MRAFLTSYFYYSRGERNGILFLAVLSLGLLIVPKIYTGLNNSSRNATDFTVFEHEIAAFVAQKAFDTEGVSSGIQKDAPALFSFNPNEVSKEDLMQLGLPPNVAATWVHFREKGGRFFKKEDVKKIYGLKATDYNRFEAYISLENGSGFAFKKYGTPPQYDGSKIVERDIVLKPFDPNTATENYLLSLGLEGKTVKVLLKFREKGGGFRTKEDLKKVYGFSDIDFLRISPFVQIAENHNIAKENTKAFETSLPFKKAETVGMASIDINQAQIKDLLVLRGIGSTFASRIIEHRERLGGFSSLNQLKEVYGLPDSTLHIIMPFLRITTSPHRKILINKSTIEELIHPYLLRKQAEVIVRYRVNHGSFKNTDDLKKTGVFTEIMAEKLKPYLVFD